MGIAKNVVLIGGGVTAGAFGLIWYLHRRGSSEGEDFGWSIFGGHGGDKVFGGAESGPLEEDGGDGGRGEKPSEGDGKDGTSGAEGDGQGTGEDAGAGASGSGKSEGKTEEGSGKGGDGSGGIGGGSGGGVGSGQGGGASHHQDDESGQGDVDQGGGSGANLDPYAGWGGTMIDVDLPAPDISEPKLEAVGNTVYELVGNQTLTTSLPPPLNVYDPNLGIDLTFWADVALHKNYSLPPGRLDPENKTHRPWIELWIFTLDLVVRAETELNAGFDDIIDEDWVGPWIPFPDDVPAA